GDRLGEGDVTDGGRGVVVVVLERATVHHRRGRARHGVVDPEAAAQQGERGDDLEGRARGEAARRGEIGAGGTVPVGAREDGPVGGPDRDERGGRRAVAERGEGVLGVLLERGVEGGHQV